MKAQLAAIIDQAVKRVAARARWEGLEDFIPEIDRPKDSNHGDFACNAALVLASRVDQKPREIAQLICDDIENSGGFIASTEIAGPGFINIRLTKDAWQRSLPAIEEPHFARPDLGKGQKILIEYVSANPTGPLHVGNARGGPLGDSLARILSQCGYEVTTEYYVNDIGGQVDRLGQSILHWMKVEVGLKSELPEGGYFGPYVVELAQLAAEHGERDYLAMSDAEAAPLLADWGMRRLLAEIRSDCEAMGSTFDRWVHEKDLRTHVDAVISDLKKAGVTREFEGALWFVPPVAGEGPVPTIDDKESVLIKSDGQPTYFVDDLICHRLRYQDGFDHIINIWGANHHGHVPRMKSALKALAYDPDSLEVLLYQYVRVCRGKEAVKMSKRAGDYVTAREVLEEVGPDAMRFFLLQRAPSAHLDFDLELATKQNAENPIYYIQYAHARICSIQDKAAKHGIEDVQFEDIEPALLDLPEELRIIQFLFEYPETIVKSAERREPHHIAYYLLDLARYFHNYYAQAKTQAAYRVISDDIDRSRAKLYLLRVVKSVLVDGLQTLNLTAPEEMRSPPEESESDSE